MPLAGEIAALTVSLLWAMGSLVFAWATGRIGALSTNTLRITAAALVLALIHLGATGAALPTWATPAQVGLLVLSAVAGLVIGDACYFRALGSIGPRRATLLASLAPVFTAVIGWLALGERLGPRALCGMAITLGGTAWVVLERSSGWAGAARTLSGTLLALGAALGQATGLILSKAAMGGRLGPLDAAVVRMCAAAALAWLVSWRLGQAGRTLAAPRDRRVMLALLAGALLGPVFGVWLSLVAVARTEAAVAATLMALTPILVIPLVWLIHRERPTLRAVLGGVIAVAGVAILVSRG